MRCAVKGADSRTAARRGAVRARRPDLHERAQRARVHEATADDIARLPPEWSRKGRFDELFFVDLPTPSVRGDIFDIHLAKRGLDAERFDRDRLVAASDGFSGAEIEQAVIAAQFDAHAADRPLDGAMLVDALRGTRPLSVVRAEEIAALRRWAAERTVSVD